MRELRDDRTHLTGVQNSTDSAARTKKGCLQKEKRAAGPLKVPKREIFLTELIILSYPIWTGDLGTKAKNRVE